LVRTVRAVPTITTLAPGRGAADPAATTVPETVPVCWAASAVVTNTAERSERTRFEPTSHLLEDDGVHSIQAWASNTARRAPALPGHRSSHPKGWARLDITLKRSVLQHSALPSPRFSVGTSRRAPLFSHHPARKLCVGDACDAPRPPRLRVTHGELPQGNLAEGP